MSKNKYTAFETLAIHNLVQSGMSYNETNIAYNELRAKDKLPSQTIPRATYNMAKNTYTPIFKSQPNPTRATTRHAIHRFSISSLKKYFNV